MILSFRDQGTADIFDGKNTRNSRKACPSALWKIAFRKLDMLDSAVSLDDLKVPPGNRLEQLSGNRDGQHSIRINNRYRICFIWTDFGPDQVEITDYHS
jgi:proteic killer suppression protein